MKPFDLGAWLWKQARGVPFARGIRTDEEARKYGVGPVKPVPFKDTEYWLLREDCLKKDPVLWAHAVTMWDLRLLPAVEEAQRVEAINIHNAIRRTEEAEKQNAPILDRLDSLVKDEAALRDQARKTIVASTGAISDKATKLAEALGAMGVEISGDPPTLALPDEKLIHSEAAHAAELQLPHDPNESKFFLNGWVYWAVTFVTGCLFGISAFSVPGMVHPSGLSRDNPFIVLFAMACGVAFTTLAGRAMKLTFRHAAERFYMREKGGWGSLITAVLTNLMMAGMYTVVDAIGLMKSNNVIAQVAALNGAKPSSGGLDLTYIVAAGAFSITYATYSSICGWMESRQSATNRITKAKEDEEITAVREKKAHEAFTAAVAALNDFQADSVAATQVAAVVDHALACMAKERELLSKQLIQPVACTEEEALLLAKARTEAEGRQAEFDKLMMTLRDELAPDDSPEPGRSNNPQSAPRKGRLGSWLREAISHLSGKEVTP